MNLAENAMVTVARRTFKSMAAASTTVAGPGGNRDRDLTRNRLDLGATAGHRRKCHRPGPASEFKSVAPSR